jgi:hypothetical protein
VTTTPPSTIPALRLAAQHISRPIKATAAELVEHMVAVQSQDFTGAKCALGLRLKGVTDAQVVQAFNAGEILRTHVLRPTWHFVVPADIRALLRLTGPRIMRQNEAMGRKMGFTSALLARTNDAIGGALSGQRFLSRDQLRATLDAAGIATEGDQRMTYYMMHAELSGIVCSGPRLGNQFSYALLDERAPAHLDPRLDNDTFLVLLAERYLRGRGPATEHDFAWWAGLTVSDARRGLAALGGSLRKQTQDEEEFWVLEKERTTRTSVPSAVLLSIYDEYISSYRSRGVIVSPADATRLVGKGNALGWVLLLDGRITGTWRRVVTHGGIVVELQPFRRLTKAERLAIEGETERYSRFLARPVELHVIT